MRGYPDSNTTLVASIGVRAGCVQARQSPDTQVVRVWNVKILEVLKCLLYLAILRPVQTRELNIKLLKLKCNHFLLEFLLEQLEV